MTVLIIFPSLSSTDHHGFFIESRGNARNRLPYSPGGNTEKYNIRRGDALGERQLPRDFLRIPVPKEDIHGILFLYYFFSAWPISPAPMNTAR